MASVKKIPVRKPRAVPAPPMEPAPGYSDLRTWGGVDRREPEGSGLAVDYYLVPITNPHRPEKLKQGIVECGDIIEALGMTFNEGTAFKAIWRKAAERTLGMKKAGNDAKRDAEKMVFYGKRELSVVTGKKVP